jgi:hypothetical protein
MALSIPNELWFEILSHEEPLKHWTTLRCVCRRLRALVEADLVRRHHLDILGIQVELHALCRTRSGRLAFPLKVFDNKGRRILCYDGEYYAPPSGTDPLLELLLIDSRYIHDINEYTRTLINREQAASLLQANDNCIDPRLLQNSDSHRHYLLPKSYCLAVEGKSVYSVHQISLPDTGARPVTRKFGIDWKQILANALQERRNSQADKLKRFCQQHEPLDALTVVSVSPAPGKFLQYTTP